MRRNLVHSVALSFVFAGMQAAWAGGGGDERAHLLSTAAGISSPSYASAFMENPAGIIFNSQTKVQGSLWTPNDKLDPLGAGAMLILGNGSAGAGVGVLGTGTDNYSLNWGLAADVGPVALGFNGSKSMKGSGAGWGLDVGALINPKDAFRIGVVGYGLADGPDAIGAGVGYDVSGATLAIDGARSMLKGRDEITVKPGLTVNAGNFSLSGGYGFEVQGKGGTPIPTGTSLGVGYASGGAWSAQFYYNQLAYYYLGVTCRL